MGYWDKLEWVDESHPEILRVPITLESRQHRNLGLDGEAPNFQTFQYIDMSKLTSLRHCFLTEEEKPDEDTCLICLSEMDQGSVGVTMCGHIFCYSCLDTAIQKFGNCPACKAKIDKSNYFKVMPEIKKVENSTLDKTKLSLQELTNTLGTKLANLITLLKERDQHTIIFSQWDNLLIRVGKILEEHGIKNLFCKGNVFRRDKCIREFNDDDKIKVIMLSSENAASGTNLTKASQVIFLDPIYGTHKYRKEQEKQAIGRAYRTGQKNVVNVIRLIIKNSIEETTYYSNLHETN